MCLLNSSHIFAAVPPVLFKLFQMIVTSLVCRLGYSHLSGPTDYVYNLLVLLFFTDVNIVTTNLFLDVHKLLEFMVFLLIANCISFEGKPCTYPFVLKAEYKPWTAYYGQPRNTVWW